MPGVETFRDHIIESGQVLDPEGVHHEFYSGMHGQKLDFDKLDDKDPLYGEWITVNTEYLKEVLPEIPEIIVGVAKGTNRVVHDVAKALEGQTVALESRKDTQDPKILHLQIHAQKIVAAVRPRLAVILEDVGTTGSNSVQVATKVKKAGARDVLVINTWKRRPKLDKLDEAGIKYQSIIDEVLPTYTPEDCEATGFCSPSKRWEFIPRVN